MRIPGYLGLTLVAATAACSSHSTANHDRTVVVKPAQADKGVELSTAYGAERIKVLADSGAEVWRVDSAELAKIAARTDARLQYVEVNAGPITQAVPAETVPVGELTADERATISAISGNVSADSIRVSRSRPLNVTADLMETAVAAPAAPSEIDIPLLGSHSARLTRTAVRPSSGSEFAWFGRVTSDGGGEAALYVTPIGVTGTLREGQDQYSIALLADGKQVIVKLGPQSLPPDHPASRALLPRAPANKRDELPAECPVKPANQINVLVALSQSLIRVRPDAANIPKLAEAQINQAFQDAGVSALVKVMDVKSTTYVDQGTVDPDLRALASGRISGLVDARRATASDLVVLLGTSEDACGVAGNIQATRETAFAVVNHRCAVDNRSFAHEIGHLMGARHDREADPTNTPFAYGHGYALKGEWRTIMAYPGSCNCPRLPRWSNPSQTLPDHLGVPRPLGNQHSDEARVMRETGTQTAQLWCTATTPHPQTAVGKTASSAADKKSSR